MELPLHDDGWIPVHDAVRVRGAVWPFYLGRRQLVLLYRIRRTWGQGCIVQIHAGRVHILAGRRRLVFTDLARLEAAVSPRREGRGNAGEQHAKP